MSAFVAGLSRLKLPMKKYDKNRRKVERIGAARLGADKTRILILGGGFAGVEAARHLDRSTAKRSDVEVTLVGRENFSLFTPMLHEVAASDLEPGDICNPLRKLLRRVTVLNGEIETIDLIARRVTISYGIRELRRELQFDYLVLALGSETNYFGIPGVAEQALGIKDATRRCHSSKRSNRNAGGRQRRTRPRPAEAPAHLRGCGRWFRGRGDRRRDQ